MSDPLAQVTETSAPDSSAGKARATDPLQNAANLQDLTASPADGPATNDAGDLVRGSAYVYTDLSLPDKSELNELLNKFRRQLEIIGLKIELQSDANQAMKTPPTSVIDQSSKRRIIIFVYLVGAVDSNNPTNSTTSLRTVLTEMKASFHVEVPKLVFFCRLRDPESFNAADISDEIAVLNLEEDQWENEYTNISLIYKRGDENNLMCFIDDLLEKIKCSNDKSNFGSCEPMCQIVQQLEKRNTKAGFHRKALDNKPDLRIEAFKLEDRLLRNHPKLKKMPSTFSPFTVPNMEDCYENNGDGRVLIIANENFEEQNRRRGTRIDCENLQDLFLKLEIKKENIDIREDRKSQEMKTDLEEFCEKEHGSFAIVVILTHGCKDRLYGTERAMGEFPNSISVEDVVRLLCGARQLAKKPKFLIINACRIPVPPSDDDSGLEVSDSPTVVQHSANRTHYWAWKSATNKDNSPNRAGLLVAYSTLPGEESKGIAFSGSRFIHTLCWVFHRYAGQEDVLSMINRVNRDILCLVNLKTNNLKPALKQLPSWTVETTKKFYLVKVSAASVGAETSNQELQCPLASIGCKTQIEDDNQLAGHQKDYTEVHRKLCIDLLSKYSSTKDELAEEKKQNASLNKEIKELRKKIELGDRDLGDNAEL